MTLVNILVHITKIITFTLHPTSIGEFYLLNSNNMFKVILSFLFLFISCDQKKQTKDVKIVEENAIDIKKENIGKQVQIINEIILTEDKKEYDSFKETLEPTIIPENEFNTFKEECNYIEEIITYYNLFYEEQLKQFKKDNWDWTRSKEQLRVNTNDSIMEISYMVYERVEDYKGGNWFTANSNEVFYVKKEDSIVNTSNMYDKYEGYDISLMTLSVPLRTNIDIFTTTPFIFGDLNNDGKKDCILTIHTEGGMSASNIYYNDIFVFLNNGDGYDLAFVKNYAQFSSAYRYYPEFIEDNYVIGTAYYLDEGDIYWDPSIKKIMKISLKKKIEN